MKQQLEQRLQMLKAEIISGQKVLAELEAKQASVRETLLRISGAIQVLEEELAKADADPGDEDSTSHATASSNNEKALFVAPDE